MKISEVLNNLTLQLPGGGKLTLDKYVPYITNAEEDAEGLTGGVINQLYDDCEYTPVAYVINILHNTVPYFSNEHDAWAVRHLYYDKGFNRYDDPLKELCNWDEERSDFAVTLLSPEELSEFINNYRKTCGELWSDNFYGGIEVVPIYKENDIESDIIIYMYISYDRIQYYIGKPILLTEDLFAIEAQAEEKGGAKSKSYYGSDSFIELINELAAQGLYIYDDYYRFNEQPYNNPEIPQEIQNEMENYHGSGDEIVKGGQDVK